MIIYFLIFILLSTLANCLGPKHRVPSHPMPHQFTYQENGSGEENLANWWQQFSDQKLNELIRHALSNNYDLRIALEKIEESRALYQFKKAELFPEIDIVSQINRTRYSSVLAQTSFLQDFTDSFFQLGFDAFWEIDIWGKIWRAKNARFYEFQAQIEHMRDVYLILIADVARLYIELCALHKKMNLLTKQISLETELVRLHTDLFNSGLSNEIVVVEQQQVLAASLDFIKTLQTDYIQRKNQLAVLLALNPEDFILLPAHDIPFSPNPLAIGMPSSLLRRRPDIRQAERLLASANELVGQAIAEWFPSFSLLGNLASETSKGSEWFTGGSLTWSIGPAINWPLINFGRIKAHIATQESVKRQAALSYSQTIIRALKEVEDFLIGYFNAQKQFTIITGKLKDATTQECLLFAKYMSGLVNQLEYIQAQRNRIVVEFEYAHIKQLVSINLVALYKALGGGW